MLKRIAYFSIGLAIGIVFLTFFFQNKKTEFCYLPNCRVLKKIRTNNLSFSDEIKAQLNDKTLDTTFISRALFDGDVDFDRSETKTKPCKTYAIEFEEKTLHFRNCGEDKSLLERIE